MEVLLGARSQDYAQLAVVCSQHHLQRMVVFSHDSTQLKKLFCSDSEQKFAGILARTIWTLGFFG